MLRKLAVAASLSFALAAPAFAAPRGLAGQAPGCTHCLPSPVTGGVASARPDRAPAHVRAEAPIAVGAGQEPARRGARAVPAPAGRALVAAECGCAHGSCPSHG